MVNDRIIKEHEHNIIAALILDSKTRDYIFKNLDGYRFIGNINTIYQAIKTMHEEKEPIDNVFLASYLYDKGSCSKVIDELIADIVLNSISTALYQYDVLKLLEYQFNTAIEQAKTIEEFENIKHFKTKIDLLKNKDNFCKIGAKNNDLNDYFDSMETKLMTGYRELDGILQGIYPSELVIIGAATGAGKTAFGINLATNFTKENKKVLFISLEMSPKEIRKRITCTKARINSLKVRGHNLSSEELELYFNTMVVYTNKLPIYINNEYGLTVSNIKTYASNLKEDGNLDVIIIDYLTLIKSKRDKVIRESVVEITNDLKQLALILNVPIICLAQLSRAPEGRDNKRPQLSDLKESSSIEQDANIVIFLYRDDYYNKESEKKNILEVCIAKSREGPSGTCELYFDRTLQNISNKGFVQ